MIVIDASLLVKLLVIESFSIQARQLFDHWEGMGIRMAAPDFIHAEVASALYKKIPAGMISIDEAMELMSEFYRMDISINRSNQLHRRAMELALELGQRMPYDSHYLALAESLNCDFWTADQPFYRAARPHYPRVQWIGNYQNSHETEY